MLTLEEKKRLAAEQEQERSLQSRTTSTSINSNNLNLEKIDLFADFKPTTSNTKKLDFDFTSWTLDSNKNGNYFNKLDIFFDTNDYSTHTMCWDYFNKKKNTKTIKL